MSILEKNAQCYGCGACESICPKNAIVLHKNHETFLYPEIDFGLCVDCGMCDRVCPLNNEMFTSYHEAKCFVGKHKQNAILFKSSSGGAFSALYDVYLKKNFVIYGVRYDDNMNVIHDRALNLIDCTKFRKSKYVQSFYNNYYDKVANDLKSGSSVLFTGVPCQCASLVSYLSAINISLDLLVTVNIQCHGVPSQQLFDDYLSELEKKKHASVVSYEFRNKRKNQGRINSRTSYVKYSNGKEQIKTFWNDAFLRGYYTRLFCRPSCYFCKYARKDRVSDITIADAWGVNSTFPQLNPLEGVSLVLLNTKKGKEVLIDLNDRMSLKEVSLEWAFNSQDGFLHPTIMHDKRNRFFEIYPNVGFRKAVFECVKLSLSERLSSIIPYSIKNRIKKYID